MVKSVSAALGMGQTQVSRRVGPTQGDHAITVGVTGNQFDRIDNGVDERVSGLETEMRLSSAHGLLGSAALIRASLNQTSEQMLPQKVAQAHNVLASADETVAAPMMAVVQYECAVILPGEKAIQAYLQAELETPRAATFQPRFLKPSTPPKRLAVIYHGFLGGPWQLQSMAEKLQADGFAVLLPTLPGHGVLDAQTQEVTSDFVPKSHEWEAYTEFADKTLALAKGTNLPMSVIGFSGGGAIANYVSKKAPIIKSAVLIAPFYHPQPKWGQVLMRVVSFLDRLTHNQAGKLFNKVPFDLVKKTTSVPNVKPRDPNKPAHKITSLGSIYALARFGHHTLALQEPMQNDCLMITSESDDQSDNKTSEKMYQKITGEKSHISLPKSLQAPHVFSLKDECELQEVVEMVIDKSTEFVEARTK
jgi:esterase/lipase